MLVEDVHKQYIEEGFDEKGVISRFELNFRKSGGQTCAALVR